MITFHICLLTSYLNGTSQTQQKGEANQKIKSSIVKFLIPLHNKGLYAIP